MVTKDKTDKQRKVFNSAAQQTYGMLDDSITELKSPATYKAALTKRAVSNQPKYDPIDTAPIEQHFDATIALIKSASTKPPALLQTIGDNAAQNATIETTIDSQLQKLQATMSLTGDKNADAARTKEGQRIKNKIQLRKNTNDSAIINDAGNIDDIGKLKGTDLLSEIAEYKRLTSVEYTPEFIEPLFEMRKRSRWAVTTGLELIALTHATTHSGDKKIDGFDVMKFLYEPARNAQAIRNALFEVYSRQITALLKTFDPKQTPTLIAQNTGLTLDAAVYVKGKTTTQTTARETLNTAGKTAQQDFFDKYLSPGMDITEKVTLEQLYYEVLKNAVAVPPATIPNPAPGPATPPPAPGPAAPKPATTPPKNPHRPTAQPPATTQGNSQSTTNQTPTNQTQATFWQRWKKWLIGGAAAGLLLAAYTFTRTEKPEYTRNYQGKNYYIDAQIEYQGKQSWVAEGDVHPGARVTAYRAVIIENGQPTPVVYIEKSALNATKEALATLETKDIRQGRLGFMSYQPEHVKTVLKQMAKKDGNLDTITEKEAEEAQKATGIDGL